MANIMVTGATGLLGRAVVRALAVSHTVTGTGFSRATDGIIRLDLTDANAVSTAVADIAPQVIVHCAAERRPDVSAQNPDAAKALNLSATEALCQAAKACGAWLIYISTDYVFDGTEPPYSEDAAQNPVNFYGETKLMGEQAVKRLMPDAAILRLPILYGEVERLNESAVLVLIEQLLDYQKQGVDDWAIRRPTSTADIADAINGMIGKHLGGETISGIYHFSAAETMTKHGMIVALAEVLGKDSGHLIAQSSPVDTARRPRDCTLSCQRMEALGLLKTRPFKEAAAEALAASQAALAKAGS
ncbi:dTDP-4-dehydrorhamnose reductase family protein [Shewanella litorisediminis]|uniref:dTDP-4-dehydrorhamnose reductase n=1 Tax=Shewanella litorisediminis TaxID=1173586 RepID=A0ABX7G4R6_9GAMM|nr:SDR family oxidoreductase [Shewanella litorisediminis]MCL2917868.1 SDR family oxidoreductase [Shewanella litorisediminis]QRH02305.1 SDR family oxidoreductase [Shewanella litorisediminis]